MFREINEQLYDAKEKLRQKRKWQDHIYRLEAHLNEEERKAESLKQQLIKEKEDVERLESFSLTNIFYTIIGKKLTKLDKEEQELLAAKLKYQEAEETINDMKQELQEYKQKHEQVKDADSQYEAMIAAKEEMIVKSHSDWSKQLLDVMEKHANVSSVLTEYDEAIDAGQKAEQALTKAQKALDSASGWSTFDMFGGGMITTAIKHGHLDDAKKHIHVAQQRLRQFQEELKDINNHFHLHLNIGNLLTFADYFFDGIIVDWMVHGKITDSYEQTKETKKAVSQLLSNLKEQKKELLTEKNGLEQTRKKLLESAK